MNRTGRKRVVQHKGRDLSIQALPTPAQRTKVNLVGGTAAQASQYQPDLRFSGGHDLYLKLVVRYDFIYLRVMLYSASPILSLSTGAES